MTDGGKKPEKNAPPGLFKVAAAGQSKLLRRLGGILFSPAFAAALPQVRLCALLLDDGKLGQGLDGLPGFADLPVYTDAQTLFNVEKDLRLILITGESEAYEQDLRRHAPPGVNLLSPSAVRFICQAVEQDTLALDGASRLMRMRETIAAMIDQMDEEVLLLDGDGRIASVNAFFLEKHGGNKTDYLGKTCREAMGENCCDQTHPQPGSPAEAHACFWENPAGTSEKTTKVYNRVNEAGQMEYFRVLLLPLPVLGKAGGAHYSMFMRKDISSLVQMEQKLQQSEKMATIGELSAYIAHEIRNPLFAISGFANALRRSPTLDDGARDKAQIILEEAQRLDAILKSFINFAKPTELEMGDIDAGQILRQAGKLAGMGDPGHKYILEERIAPNLPKVRGNTELLREGLGNIIKNAQEAMPDGGKIIVSAAPSGHMVELAVEDFGSGIPEKEQTQIFNPFYSTKGKGAGLGLAMTKKFVEDMGGKVSLVSSPGQGTRVSLLLLPALAVSQSTVSMVSTPRNGTSITVTIPK